MPGGENIVRDNLVELPKPAPAVTVSENEPEGPLPEMVEATGEEMADLLDGLDDAMVLLSKDPPSVQRAYGILNEMYEAVDVLLQRALAEEAPEGSPEETAPATEEPAASVEGSPE